MTLCEIVKQAKDGEKFQGDWHKEKSPECYFFIRGSFIWIHLEEGREKMWDSSSVAVFKADYTFLPPEPKFKVGDEVKVIDTNNIHFVITGMELHKNEWSYHSIHSEGTRLDTYRECGLELYTKPKFKTGNRVKVTSCKIHSHDGKTYTICSIVDNRYSLKTGHLYGVDGMDFKLWESELTLYNPDICEECGQEIQVGCKNYEPIRKDKEEGK